MKGLQEEVNRLHSIRVKKQDRLFTEMSQSQDSQESQTSTVVEKQVDSEPCTVISQETFSQGSVQDEG